MRFSSFVATVIMRAPVQYVLRFMIFWWAQAVTLGRSCTQVPHPVIAKSPFERGHNHWCGKHNTDHGVHVCHGCPMQWYESANGNVWLYRDGESELHQSRKTPDSYGFVVYPIG